MRTLDRLAARPSLAGLALALLALGATPAAAQSRQGRYRVAGTETGRGAYAGQAELRWTGSGYAFVREVEFATFTYRGRPVSTAWTGTARDAAGGVDVDLRLDRMGWAGEAAGLPPRTAADGVPMPIHATLVGQGGTLVGRFVGQGAPFLDPGETWTLVGPAGPAPLWAMDRVVRPSHRAPSSLERRLFFALFASFHRTAWIAPYVNRPGFQAGVHGFVLDRTDLALHRQRPDLLRVLQRLVDPLALEEAVVKADAFGKTLRAKADLADAEVPARFVDPSGALVRRDGAGAQVNDGDGCLWTGVYAYTQALRLQATGDPLAAQNVERTVRALLVHMTITGQADSFARTLQTTSAPPTPGWRQGSGPHAGVQWKEGGNNDMLKGLLLGALALHEALPAQAALKAEYGQALAALTAAHSVMQGARHSGNRTMANGLVALLQGGGPARDRYRRLARNPFQLLADVATAGGVTYQGQADWSGTHLALCGLIMQMRLATLHGERIVEAVDRLAARRAHARLTPIRRSLHTLAAAALAGLPRAQAEDAVWHLREMPFPRARLSAWPQLRQDWCPSPWPNLPWKRDWTTDRGRALGLVSPPLFERHLGNYIWKSAPTHSIDGGGSVGEQYHSTDFLFPYWLARAHGVLTPGD